MKQIKKEISRLVEKAAIELLKAKNIKLKNSLKISIEKTKDEKFGDYATNAALILSRQIKESPMDTAASLSNLLGEEEIFSKNVAAPPGFINFYLSRGKLYQTLKYIIEKEEQFGRYKAKHQKIQVEFVSANPTGPLHVGHGRVAATGDCIANLLSAYGYKVSREYYINNVGGQIETLGISVKWRYLELLGDKNIFCEEWNGYETYQGEYIKEIALHIKEKYAGNWRDKQISCFSRFAMDEITKDIKQNLEDFGVKFDSWFKESELFQKKEVQKVEKELEKQGYIEERDGARWFKSSLFGDTKDRVIIRKNKVPTYLASDIAYHARKFKHFKQAINVWGADHHGYIPRMKAAVQALGYEPANLKIVLVQLVKLSRGKEQIPMSTRKGKFVTLEEVLSEVGKDAARFIFMTRKNTAQLDFDMELAKKKSLDNPVYYIQYAHARLCSILNLSAQKNLKTKDIHSARLDLLKEKEELHLIKLLAGFPDIIEESALSLEPHRITIYLKELAQSFHSFYSIHRVISDDLELSLARLTLIKGIQIIIKNALKLLGVNAPEKM